MVATNVIQVGSMPRRKQIYKITYPNGKIYVGMDLIGTLINVGSPSARERIAADLDAHRLDLTLRKEILWESETATDGEVRAMEERLIRETGANDPAIGYNIWPRWLSAARHSASPTIDFLGLRVGHQRTDVCGLGSLTARWVPNGPTGIAQQAVAWIDPGTGRTANETQAGGGSREQDQRQGLSGDAVLRTRGFRRDRTPRLRERRGPRRRLQRMERRGASDDRTRVLRNLTALRKVDRFDERQD